MSALGAIVPVVVAAAATTLAARRAGFLHRRAALIGRVTGHPPPRARPVRSIRPWLRAPRTRLAIGAFAFGWLWLAPFVGVVAAVGVAVAPRVIAMVQRSREDAAYDATLTTALDAVARGVRSGGSLAQAVGEAHAGVRGPVARDLQRVAAAVARGRPFAAALVDWREERPRPAVRLATGALVLATQTGGPPARVIEDVASAIRMRQQVEREAHALAAQARLSAVVVGLAPVGFMTVMCLTDPRNAHVLFGTPIGIGCVVTGITLDALGAYWMHRMSTAVLA